MPSFGPAMPTKSTAAVSLNVRYACTGMPRRRRVLVAGERELVLLAAADLPLLRHLLAVLAHRHSGARLADAGMRRRDVPGAQLADGAQLVAPALAARHREDRALQVAAVGERHVARAVGAAGDG